MKLTTALAIAAATVLGLVLLVPLVGFVLSLALSVGWFLIWLLPIVIIAMSDKTTGWEKLAWILAIVFLSWFAWVLYFFFAPLKPRRAERYPAYGR